MLEDDVRLDQLVAAKGDAIWYEYDVGDGWDDVLQVQEVLDERPATVRCLGGRMACPPEDCGGIGGNDDLAAWVRSGYDDAQLPEFFDDAAQARDWLPLEWHPDHFAVDEANAALSVALAEPVAVTGERAELLERLERRGIRSLREVLGRPLSHGPTDVTDDEAARLTEPSGSSRRGWRWRALTSAGHLPPKLVEQSAERTRLPLGTKDFDRHAGCMALAVVGSVDLGWRTDEDLYSPPPARSPTLVVLNELAGAARTGWRVTGTDLAVAATARSVIRRR